MNLDAPSAARDHRPRFEHRLGLVLVTLFALAVAVAACGTEDDVVTGVPTTDRSDATAPPTAPPLDDGDAPFESPPLDPNDPTVDPGPVPEIVQPTGNTADPRMRPWESAQVGDDDTTVAILFWSGVEPCYVLDRVEVVETDETVTITLFEGSDPTQPDVACIEIAVTKVVVVALDAPLGDRSIIDGAA